MPFCPTKKIMTVAYRIKENAESEAVVRVIMKGAPEEVLKYCVHKLDDLGFENEHEGEKYTFDGAGEEGLNYLEDVVEVIASEGECGEKPITIAYRDYSIVEF